MTNKIDPAREEQLGSWWVSYLYTVPGETDVESLTDYAISHIGDIRFVGPMIKIVRERLHQCKARTESQFRQWCRHQINKLQNKRAGTKEFIFEPYGDICVIPLYSADETHIWTIPADWLDSARLLWPVHIRRLPDGKPYVSRKLPTPGGQKDVAVHRLFLGLSPTRYELADNLEVLNRNGSWLDYTSGNLYLARGSDMMDHRTSKLEVAEFKGMPAFHPKRVWRTATEAATCSRLMCPQCNNEIRKVSTITQDGVITLVCGHQRPELLPYNAGNISLETLRTRKGLEVFPATSQVELG